MTDRSEFRTALSALDMDRRHNTGDPLVRDAVWFMTDGHCAECKVKLSPGTFHVDHVKPAIRRGEDHITNYQPLCRPCNTSKGENADIDYRSDEVRWLLGIGDEPEKLRAEREVRTILARLAASISALAAKQRLIAAQQRLDDTFGELSPTKVLWAWEHEAEVRRWGREGHDDFDAIVKFSFEDDAQVKEVRCLLEMHPESLVALVYQWAKDLDHVDLDGTVSLEFDLPHYKVDFSAPQSAFLAAVFPELETQDLLRRVQCRNDWCTQDPLIPDIVFNGYCKRCVRKIREIALGLRYSMQREEPRDDVQTATLGRGYWLKLGQLPYLRSIWAEEDISYLLSCRGRSQTNALSMAVEIERLIGAERGD